MTATTSMPMLKNKGSGIPGGWRYLQPETKTLLKAQNWWGLVALVKRHREANRIPMANLEQAVEDYVIEQLSTAGHHHLIQSNAEREPDRPPEIRKGAHVSWKWSDVVRFTMTLGDAIVSGNNRVTHDEAERRAGICAPCPSNIPLADCNFGCGSLKADFANFIARVVGGETTQDAKLQACEFCGCINRAQIWFPLDVLQRHTAPEIDASLPSHCWKKQAPPAAMPEPEPVVAKAAKKSKGKK